MKIITIGRGEDCDIQIDDPMVSRRQALLRISPTGKMELIDYSRNGTMVNGRKIPRETPIRVRRNDSVTFSGLKNLDWSQVPGSRPLSGPLGIGIGVAALLVIGVIVAILVWPAGSDDTTVINSYGGGGAPSVEQRQPDRPGQSDDAYQPIAPGSRAPRGMVPAEKKKTAPRESASADKGNVSSREQVNDTVVEAPKAKRTPAQTQSAPKDKAKKQKGKGFKDKSRKGL